MGVPFRRQPKGWAQAWQNRWAATEPSISMAWLDGEPLGGRGELGATLERNDEAARLLADLHRSGVKAPAGTSERSAVRGRALLGPQSSRAELPFP